MRRRDLILGVGGVVARPLVAMAQQPGMPVVGLLSSLSFSAPWASAFRHGLAEMGYVEGRNVAIDDRWVEGGYDALPSMAADLVQRQVAVIGAFGPPAVVAAKAAAPSIPIVFITGADPLFASRQEHLVGLAATHRVPAIYEWREFVETGGLMSYGTVVRDGLFKGGSYAGRILKGAKPADLPVEQLNKLELVINLKTAQALGLIVPQVLLARADGVIE